MLITARGRSASVDNRGMAGHAVSEDLATWTVQEPWTSEGSGFAQLEVIQVIEVQGRWALVFSCFPSELASKRGNGVQSSGMWSVAVDSPTGPYDLTQAAPLTGSSPYAGKIVASRDGTPVLLASTAHDDQGNTVGGICDPLPME